MRHLFLVLILSLTLFNQTNFAQSDPLVGTIKVHVQQIESNNEGELLMVLFDNEESWLVTDQYYKIIKMVPGQDSLIVIFEDIPYSTQYAIEVIHDENANQKLDMRILPYPKPKEGFGLSNNLEAGK